MAKTIKFVYNVILFVFLFLVLTFGENECVRDDDCIILYPNNTRGTMVCFHGTCKTLPPPYKRVSTE
ncbi:hypothetical protein P8452_64290 [Trifolium repens]|nr:hypothetical protein P8452_64288 [Trifolium repens]WJX81402.1 hypothetical protein P8452_64289 [Trifolium repens]WJX81403.1 hypothetical protein P8452_64290 [Trifolium repens]